MAPALMAASVMAASVIAGGCSSSLPKSVGNAPSISVATGLWPLAQAAQAIGGDKVVVDDVVPPGADPLSYRPGAAQAGALRGAGLVIEIGGSFQPGVEAAAKGAPSVLQLGSRLGTRDPYVWLDPATMTRAVQAITSAMTAANPAAAPLYQRNAGAFEDEVKSLGIDYSSTLSACPGTNIVTPDLAFTAMATDFGLTDHVIGPRPAGTQVQAEKAQLDSGSAVGALSEPWVDDQGVVQVARAASLHVHTVDTLAGAPTGASASGSSGQTEYFTLMEQLLATMSSSLGCNANEQ